MVIRLQSELREGTLCQTRLIRSLCPGLTDWFVLGLGTQYSFSPHRKKPNSIYRFAHVVGHYAELVFLCSNKACPLLEVKVHRFWMNALLKFCGFTVLALAIKKNKEPDVFRSNRRSTL